MWVVASDLNKNISGLTDLVNKRQGSVNLHSPPSVIVFSCVYWSNTKTISVKFLIRFDYRVIIRYCKISQYFHLGVDQVQSWFSSACWILFVQVFTIKGNFSCSFTTMVSTDWCIYSWIPLIQTQLFQIPHCFKLKTKSLWFAFLLYYWIFRTPVILNHFSLPLRVWNSRVQL